MSLQNHLTIQFFSITVLQVKSFSFTNEKENSGNGSSEIIELKKCSLINHEIFQEKESGAYDVKFNQNFKLLFIQ